MNEQPRPQQRVRPHQGTCDYQDPGGENKCWRTASTGCVGLRGRTQNGCQLRFCPTHGQRVAREGCPLLDKPDTDDEDGIPEGTEGTDPNYPANMGSGSLSSSSSGSSTGSNIGSTGTSPATRAIITEINTEIDRRGTGGQTRLWSIQALVTGLNWAQVGRWDDELKKIGADRCGVGELNGADGWYPRSLKTFRKTCNTAFAFQQLSFTDQWSATLHRPRGPLQLGATQEGVTRLVVVLVGVATYAGGRPLPRAAVHLYSPDTPLSDITAAGRTHVLLLVLEQKMKLTEDRTCDPPAGLRSQILKGDGRPGDKHDVLQIVDIALDNRGGCIPPPSSSITPGLPPACGSPRPGRSWSP